MLEPSWVGEAARFIEASEHRAGAEPSAAVFQPGATAGRPILFEAMSLLRVALGGAPRPEQGLMIAKRVYESLGGHRDRADTERDLLRRLGRRRIVMLRAGRGGGERMSCSPSPVCRLGSVPPALPSTGQKMESP